METEDKKEQEKKEKRKNKPEHPDQKLLKKSTFNSRHTHTGYV